MKSKNEAKSGPEDLNARVDELKRQAGELEKQLRIARGTGDVTEQARAVGGDLAARIEAALRERPRSIEELSRELRETPGRVSAVMRPMRKRLFNAGTEHAPAWFWIVGDDAPAAEINAAVRALVAYRPMRFPELCAATSARQGRVSGAIVAMQRDPRSRLANLDVPTRARWFIVPEGVAVSRLRPR